MNGNGNGRRIEAHSVDTYDAHQYCLAASRDGGIVLSDHHLYEDDGGSRHWTTVWNSLPAGTAIIRVTVFAEGGGYWEPVQLPPTQTDEQIIAVEKILNLHHLSLMAVVGLKQGGRRAL